MRVAAVAAVLGVLALAACGDDGPSEVDQAISDLDKASGGKSQGDGALQTGGGETPPSATAFIGRYFDLIDQDQFTEAWALVDQDLQEEFGGYESWRAGYVTNTATEVIEADVTSTVGEETDVTVRIRAIDDCEGETFEREFEGPFSVNVPDEKLTEAEFAQVSGDSLPSDCS